MKKKEIRQIKFRVWDNILKYYHRPNSFVYRLDGLLFYRQTKEELSDILMEQYTGLKDKNSVEIYEGDILDTIGKVYFKKGCFMASGIPLSLSASHRTILGNIHENYELLKK